MPRIIDKVAQNTDLPPAIRQQAVEKMTRWLKQGLLRLGVMKSISRGEWANAQRVADILMREFPQSRAVRSIRWATAVSRMLPGSPFIVRALFALRTGEKIMRNLGLLWEFRAYSRFLRASTLAASRVNLPSAVCRASEDGGAAHRLHDSRSARKIFS